ncbi:hypothetical protein CI109_104639 [Kwoniella shandongensis]|uniref:Spindle pole body component n=1 Tax=Kwoniella shandongensis TaxID=1734106 RepID=A0A5M6BZG0_9TREE|nr:uncharacterized protein CI109_004805 [Kwoniella shandongensis]KAA5526805.1 hypothetical protein CI109_004805 [Kwoniella shandongensis]
MLAETLLVLGGHPSSFFIASPPAPSTSRTYIVSPSLSEYLHPGEVASLNSLGSLAFRYRRIKTWAEETHRKGREAVLVESLTSSSSGKGKHRETAKGNGNDDAVADDSPNQYLSTLAASLLDVLGGYDLLLVETEARVLALDPVLVQDQQGYVPLSSLVAKFDRWQAPLASLSAMVDQLSAPPSSSSPLSSTSNWTPGKLLDLIAEKTQTGNPFLEQIYTTIASALRHLFLTHLVSFLLYGIAPTRSTPTTPSLALDVGPDPLSPQHRVYALNEEMLPSSVKGKTRESVVYVGRVTATLRREERSLPKSLVDGLREEIMRVTEMDEGGGLDEAIQRARAEIGEWLWKHILTGPQVAESIETFANFFLARRADYSISVIREISKLRLDKLITSNPHSSSSVIREQDLDLALLRASVGTTAETDHGLEKLRFKLENGPLRAILPSVVPARTPKKGSIGEKSFDERNGIRDLFSSSLLGTPLTLTTTITWPLDLFMTPPAISAYSDIHAYLTAIQDTHIRVLDCWTSLSAAQRQRRKWTGVNEGGTAEGEVKARKNLARSSWGTVRAMLFFLDQLQSHFMTDIIDVQHRRLLEQLELVEGVSSGASVLGGSTRGSLKGSVRQTDTQTREGTTYAPSLAGERTSGSPFSESHAGFGMDSQTVRSSRVPPTPTKAQNNFLDFLTLRQMHTRHLSFLREGLLISDPALATVTRDILDTCKRFTGLVERWGGDVLPELLMEGVDGEEVGKMVGEHADAVKEINETLHDLLVEFFSALLETQNPTSSSSDPDKSSAGGNATSFSRTTRVAQMSRMMSRQSSFTLGAMNAKTGGVRTKKDLEREERGLEAEVVMSRHIEQLLLRLDFNGVLTAWKLKEDEGDLAGKSVLAEGGL